MVSSRVEANEQPKADGKVGPCYKWLIDHRCNAEMTPPGTSGKVGDCIAVPELFLYSLNDRRSLASKQLIRSCY